MAAAKQVVTQDTESKGIMASGRQTIVQSFELVQMVVSVCHRSAYLADAELKNLQTIQAIRMAKEQATLINTCSTLGISMPEF